MVAISARRFPGAGISESAEGEVEDGSAHQERGDLETAITSALVDRVRSSHRT